MEAASEMFDLFTSNYILYHDLYNYIKMQAKKVVIIGDSGVGKTAIMNRYLFDRFDPESMPTLGSSMQSR